MYRYGISTSSGIISTPHRAQFSFALSKIENHIMSSYSQWIEASTSADLQPLIGKRTYWQSNEDPTLTTWISSQQLDLEYYLHLQKKHRIPITSPGQRKTKYFLGGYTEQRRTIANVFALRPIVIEDFPSHARLRERLIQQCLTILEEQTKANGGDMWQGDTKTAKAIRKEGMRKGLQGIFGRIVWFELLEEVHHRGDVGSLERDSIFPLKFQGDPAVIKEFLEGGRTVEQTQQIMRAVGDFMENACRQLCAERNRTDMKMSASLNAVRLEDTQVGSLPFKRLSCDGGSLEISSEHFQKMLRLYRLHTDTTADSFDPVFVSNICFN
jgi:hypothetical protein